MKKILLGLAMLLMAVGVQAQTAAGRTASTKVSDALGLMPARDQAEFNRLMDDLVSTGASGVDMLTAMFDNTNNKAVNYALSGWAAYVSAPGREEARLTFAEGVGRALQKSDDPVIQAYLIRLLQRCGGDESVELLGGYLQDEKLGDPARCALLAIGTPAARALVAEPTPVTVHFDAPVTDIAALYASQQALGDKAVSSLLKALKSKDRAYRNAALRFLQPYLNESVLAALAKELKKAKPETKVDIINFLGLHDAQSVLPAILPYIGNENEELSTAAMSAAIRLKSQEAMPVIASLLGDANTSDQVRAEARECLLASSHPVDALMADVVRTGCDAGKVEALSILGARRSSAYAGLVLEMIGNSNPDVVAAAYAALPKVVTSANIAALYPLVESASGSDLDQARAALIEAQSTLPVEERMAAIKERMKLNPAVAPNYYVVLASISTPEALQIVTDGFESGDAAARQQVLEALLAWKTLDGAEMLYKIAGSDDTAMAEKAIDGYAQLVEMSDKTPEIKQIMLTEAMNLARTPAMKIAVLNRMRNTKTLQGMVLAGKYLDDSDPQVQQAAVNAIYHTALERKDLYGPVVVDLLTRAVELSTNPDQRYQVEEVKKHIKSMPEGGFVSMFNGTDLTGWKGLVENPVKRAEMSAEELAAKQQVADEMMHRDWKAGNGILSYVGTGYDNICTEKQYRDFEMYVDWRLDPNGKEPDAGIYLRGNPQVQIWDTARRNVGAQVGSGGLYNNKVNESKPSHVADNTLGQWNTMFIRMQGDRVSVWLNGEQVVDNVIMENFWDRSQPIPAIEQIELQAHGSRVDFRNLYINELPSVEPFRLSPEEEKEGFKVLFDGTNMHEWIGNTRDYVNNNGMISLIPHKGSYGGNLYTRDEYKDFIFRFEFKLTPGANNGLGIRTPTEGDAAYVGMELQILDHDAPIYKNIAPYQVHGSVYGVIAAKRAKLKIGEWNYEEVIAKGTHIKVILNGEVIVDGDIAEASKNGTETVDHREHPGLLNEKGHIGFLGHGSEVHFRNIRIKEL